MLILILAFSLYFFIIIYTNVLVIPSCPIFCDSIDSTSPFSVTPWTIARQAPLSIEFSRQEYCIGFPFPSPGDKTDWGINPKSLELQADSLLSDPPGMPYSLFKSLFITNSNELCKNILLVQNFLHILSLKFLSVRPVMSDSLPPHGLQHAGLPVHHQLLEFTQTYVH